MTGWQILLGIITGLVLVYAVLLVLLWGYARGHPDTVGLRDALRLEGILSSAGVDYGVEADEYKGGIIFHSVRTGAFFYVLPEALAAAHDIMRRNGYKPYAGPAEAAPE